MMSIESPLACENISVSGWQPPSIRLGERLFGVRSFQQVGGHHGPAPGKVGGFQDVFLHKSVSTESAVELHVCLCGRPNTT